MGTEIEFVDRYSALGIPRPNPETVCRGHCEGVGWFPENDQASPLWIEAHKKCTPLGWLKHCWAMRHDVSFWWNVRRGWWSCDGWHFVKCPDCGGSGKRSV